MVTRNEHPPQAQEFHLVLALSQRGKFSEITQISTLKLIRYLNRHAKKGADDDRDDQTVCWFEPNIRSFMWIYSFKSSCGKSVVDMNQFSLLVTPN